MRVGNRLWHRNWNSFLTAVNKDPDNPLEPPVGRSGRKETARKSYGIDAVNEFDPLFEDMYDYCEIQNLGYRYADS